MDSGNPGGGWRVLRGGIGHFGGGVFSVTGCVMGEAGARETNTVTTTVTGNSVNTSKEKVTTELFLRDSSDYV